MNFARQHAFAGPGFAEKQHVRLALRGLEGQINDFAHLGRFRGEVKFRPAGHQSRFQIGHTAFEFPGSLDVAQNVANLLEVHGFGR